MSLVSRQQSKRARLVLPHVVAQRAPQMLTAHLLQLEAQVPSCPCRSSAYTSGCHAGGTSSRRIRWCACGRRTRDQLCTGETEQKNVAHAKHASTRRETQHQAAKTPPREELKTCSCQIHRQRRTLVQPPTADAQFSKTHSAAITTATDYRRCAQCGSDSEAYTENSDHGLMMHVGPWRSAAVSPSFASSIGRPVYYVVPFDRGGATAAIIL